MHNKMLYITVMGSVFMLAPFAIDMYLPALPTIADSLHTGIDEMEATVAIFLIGFAFGQIVLGPLSDALGRRRVIIGGLAVFVISSLMLGVATDLVQFYIWRFLQALGGAGSVAVFPMVKDQFGEAESAKVISYIMAMIVVAPLIAPIIGGYVLVISGWRAIFLLIAILAVTVLVLIVTLTRKEGRHHVPVKVTGIVRGYKTVLSEKRIVVAILSGGFAFAGLFAFVAGSPFVYISYLGVAPEHYGYLVALNAVAMILTNIVNAQLPASSDAAKRVFWGSIVLILSGLLILGVAIFDFGLILLVVAAIVFFGAMGITETNSVIISYSVLPKENGSVAALNGAFQFGIGALSSFIVSIISSTSAIPMATVMAGSGLAVFLCAMKLKRL